VVAVGAAQLRQPRMGRVEQQVSAGGDVRLL
jgi:hypothetical protein